MPDKARSLLEVHTLDLGELETTKESFQGDSILEGSGNPLAGEFCTTTQPAQRFQLDRIRLVLGRWLLSGPVIDFSGLTFAVRGQYEVGGVPLREVALAGA
jgi:hypothetical protein